MPSRVVSESIVQQPVIRRATRHDVSRIVDLLQQTSLGDELRESPGPPLPQGYLDAFAAIDADPDNELMVAEVDGIVQGTFLLTILQTLARAGA